MLHCLDCQVITISDRPSTVGCNSEHRQRQHRGQHSAHGEERMSSEMTLRHWAREATKKEPAAQSGSGFSMFYGAADRIRTDDINLGKVALYH